MRSQLAEHGLVAAEGRRGFGQLAALLAAGDARVPAALVQAMRRLATIPCGSSYLCPRATCP